MSTTPTSPSSSAADTGPTSADAAAPKPLAPASTADVANTGRVERWIMGAILLTAGIGHFVSPKPFASIVPKWVPFADFWVYATGVAEVVLGAAMFTKFANRKVGYAVVGLLLLVFPANVWMAISGTQIEGLPPVPTWAAWGRLPLQVVMIWLALRGTAKNEAAQAAQAA